MTGFPVFHQKLEWKKSLCLAQRSKAVHHPQQQTHNCDHRVQLNNADIVDYTQPHGQSLSNVYYLQKFLAVTSEQMCKMGLKIYQSRQLSNNEVTHKF